MKEGKRFKFRGETFRITNVFLDTILAVNEDNLLDNIRRFANLKLIK